jgi:hypothetical protein
LIAYTLTTYAFKSDNPQSMIFDGSTVTIGVQTLGIPSVNGPYAIFGFDIKDPNALGGEVQSAPATFLVHDITSASASGWTGSFSIDYTKALGGNGTLTLTGTDPTGSIIDTDPITANGVWTPVAAPDEASTMLLLALTTGLMFGIRYLQTGSPSPRMLVSQA